MYVTQCVLEIDEGCHRLLHGNSYMLQPLHRPAAPLALTLQPNNIGQYLHGSGAPFNSIVEMQGHTLWTHANTDTYGPVHSTLPPPDVPC
jgi:hypothetical protein